MKNHYPQKPVNSEYTTLTMMLLHYRVQGSEKKSMDEGRSGMHNVILEPHENDVLMGRGGKNNQHLGNEKLRKLARRQSEEYRMASKKGKSFISRQLVKQVRMMNPPGRFLKKDNAAGTWEDVGDDIAREKASQVLRDAVSLTSQSPTQDDSDEDREKQMEENNNSEHRRSSSAPPLMHKNARRRPWDETSEQARYEHYETPAYTSSMSSCYTYPPPVTPSSKRRRYHSDITWDERLAASYHPSSHERYPYQEYARPASYPDVSRSAPYVHNQGSPSGLMGHVHSALDEFDLFNGELLKSDTEEEGSVSPRDAPGNEAF
jgi:hypothetical protein